MTSPINPRRVFNVTEEQHAQLKAAAKAHNMSLSAYLGDQIVSYLNGGTKRQPPPRATKRIQVVIDPAIAAQAEERARREGWQSLREVLLQRLEG